MEGLAFSLPFVTVVASAVLLFILSMAVFLRMDEKDNTDEGIK